MMRRPILALLSALISLPVHAADAAQQVFERAAASVVTVLGFDEQGRQDVQGSGVVVAASRVVTNCHVLREVHALKVVSGAQSYVANWALSDPERDLCLLQVVDLNAPPVKMRKLDSVRVGEAAYAIGNPLGFGLSVSAGLVSHKVVREGAAAILSSAPQSPGSSGGGVFDGKARLLGIATGILGAGQNINLVLPSDLIEALLTRGVAPPVPVSLPGPEPRWIDEAAALLASGNQTRLEQHARDWMSVQPDAALPLGYLAAALIGQARYQEAEATLREALRLDDHNDYFWRLLASSLHELGRQDEVASALARAQALLASSGSPYQLRANWLLQQQRAADAAAELREAIRREPGTASFWADLGRAEELLGNREAAARAFRVALRLAPADNKLKQDLAKVLARQGQIADARVALGQEGNLHLTEANTWLALGQGEYKRQRYADAEKALRKAIELAPELEQAWFLLGSLLGDTKRYAEAIKAFDHGLSIQVMPSLLRSEVLHNRAVAQQQSGNLAAAEADARRAIEIAPDQAPAYRLLGILSFQRRDYHQAVAAYRKVVALGAAGIDDWVSLADSLDKIGQRKAALQSLQYAEKLDAKHLRLLQSLAAWHGRTGNLQLALRYSEQALSADATDMNNWSSQGYALLKLGRLEEAIRALQTAVSLDPGSANAAINLGEALLRNGNLGLAIQRLEKAVTLAPAALDARLYLAQAYLGSGQPRLALQHLEPVLQRLPDMPAALSAATLANLKLGKRDVARQSYLRLRAKDAAAASEVRRQALRQKLARARELPE